MCCHIQISIPWITNFTLNDFRTVYKSPGRNVSSVHGLISHLTFTDGIADKSKSPYSFVIASAVCFKWEVLDTVVPRAAVVGFSFAQPFFITAVINYLQTPPALRNKNHASGLVGAAALIYGGMAVCTIDSV
jgi:hypothetical protein